MRLERLRANRIGTLEKVDIDLSGLAPGAVVAVIGKNGAGKSTLLELFPGALYRELPTRGPLSAIADARDSYLEAVVQNGQRWTLRHSIDGVSKKAEALALDADGRPVTPSAKVTEFDAWARDHLTSPEVQLAGPFLAQGSSGLLNMTTGERKAVCLRALGIDRLERLSEGARARARTIADDAAMRRRRVSDVAADAADLEKAEQDAAEAATSVTGAHEALSAAQAAEDVAREEHERVQAAEQKRDAWRAARDGKLGALSMVRNHLGDVRERMRNNMGLLAAAEKIRGDAAEHGRLKLSLEDADRAAAAASATLDVVKAELAAAWAEKGRIERARVEATQEVGRLRVTDADREAAEHALASEAQNRELLAECEKFRDSMEAKVAAAMHRRLADKDDRIRELRGALTEITEQPEIDAAWRAGEALKADDDSVSAVATRPAELTQLTRDLDMAKRSVANLQAAVAGAEKARGLQDRLDAHTRAVEAAGRQEAEDRAAGERIDEIKAREVEARANVDAANRERARIANAMRPLGDSVKKLEHLERAEIKIAEYRATELIHVGDEAQLDAEIAALGEEPSVPVRAHSLSGATAEVGRARNLLGSRETRRALADERLKRAREAHTRLSEAKQELATVEVELADWTLLADSLGRNGVQAMAIDAAGPALTDTVNALLHEAFGPHFSVRIDTTARTADGKKEKEVFEIAVLDTQKGRELAAERLSGGERTIVGEAISWALSVLACQRAGLDGPTIVRDESGAALDPENRPRYIAMLRRAAKLARASAVLFVSHSEDTWDIADARIVVANGTAVLA